MLSSNVIEHQKIKKRFSSEIEGILSPKSSEDQKQKRSAPKIEGILSPKSSEDQKKKVFTAIWYYIQPEFGIYADC